jgi:hypothetical protein
VLHHIRQRGVELVGTPVGAALLEAGAVVGEVPDLAGDAVQLLVGDRAGTPAAPFRVLPPARDGIREVVLCEGVCQAGGLAALALRSPLLGRRRRVEEELRQGANVDQQRFQHGVALEPVALQRRGRAEALLPPLLGTAHREISKPLRQRLDHLELVEHLPTQPDEIAARVGHEAPSRVCGR